MDIIIRDIVELLIIFFFSKILLHSLYIRFSILGAIIIALVVYIILKRKGTTSSNDIEKTNYKGVPLDLGSSSNIGQTLLFNNELLSKLSFIILILLRIS